VYLESEHRIVEEETVRKEVESALTAAAGRIVSAPPDEFMDAIVGEVLVGASSSLSPPPLTEKKEEIEAKLDETLGTIKDELKEHKVDKAAKITGAAATAAVGGGLVLGGAVSGGLIAALVVSGAAAYGAYKSAKTAAPVVREAAITTAASMSLSFDGYKSLAKKVVGRLRHK